VLGQRIHSGSIPERQLRTGTAANSPDCVDPLTFRNGPHAFPYRLNDPGGIHPGGERQLGELGIRAGSDIGVRRVDTDGADPDDHLPRAGLRVLNLFHKRRYLVPLMG
jgi:hypothetical protein